MEFGLEAVQSKPVRSSILHDAQVAFDLNGDEKRA